MRDLPPRKREQPVIRIFVSSTFSDLKLERDALQKWVFPNLEERCLKEGFQFQAIDLRWGVPTEAGLHHRTMQICFEELRRSQEISPEPNFLIILGDRYGWRPLPERISESEFDRLALAANTGGGDGRPIEGAHGKSAEQILRDWYRRDGNIVENTDYRDDPDRATLNYILQPRTQTLEDQRDYTRSAGVVSVDTRDWTEVQWVLWKIINATFSAESFSRRFDAIDWPQYLAETSHPENPARPVPQIVRFLGSATEQEIWSGALSAPKAGRHILGLFRECSNREEFLGSKGVEAFVDLNEEGGFDLESLAKQTALKRAIADRLGENAVKQIPFSQLEQGDGGIVIDAPIERIRSFCREIEDHLWKVVERQIDDYWTPQSSVSTGEGHSGNRQAARELEIEQEEHLRFALEHGKRNGFVGRATQLALIDDYLESESRDPLVIYGDSGSGKTGLMARAFLDTPDEYAPVVRFIGVTPNSTDLVSLLQSLCQEFRQRNPIEGSLPFEVRELIQEFRQHLAAATEDSPLVLFLDALDQLSDAESGRHLFWLPRGRLPANVKVILSCLSDRADDDPAGEPFSAIRRRNLPGRNLHQVRSLSRDEAEALIFDRWLPAAGRRVTAPQKRLIVDCFDSGEESRRPLYLRLLFEEAKLWHSWEAPSPPGKDIPQLMERLFDRLSEPARHGQSLTSRILRYLAAARRGLSEIEVQEVLFADPDFRNELDADSKRNNYELPVEPPRIPIAIWSRFRADLGPYLTERSAPGGIVLSFYHRHVKEAVESRYLAGEGRRQAHAGLVRLFAEQPHYIGPSYTAGERRRSVHARLVDEYPWQLVEGILAGDVHHRARLETLLSNLEFLEAKCLAGAVYDLESDFVRAQASMEDSRDERAEMLGRFASAIAVFARNSRVGSAPPEMGAPHPADGKERFPLQPEVPAVSEETTSRLPGFAQFLSTFSHKLVDYPYETAQFARRFSTNPGIAAKGKELLESRRYVTFESDPDEPDPPTLWKRTIRHSAKSVAIDYTGRIGMTVGGKETSVRFWDLTTGAPVRTTTQTHDDVDRVAMTPDGRFAITAGGTWGILATSGIQDGFNVSMPTMGSDGPIEIIPDYTIHLWDVTASDCVGELAGHTESVESVAITADAATAISVSRNNELRLWNVSSGECLRSIRNLPGIRTLSMDAAGKTCIGVCESGRIHIWEVGTLNWRFIRPATPEGKFKAARITPDGTRIIGLTGNTVVQFNRESDSMLREVPLEGDLDDVLVISPDGNTAYCSSGKTDLLICDLSSENHGQRRIPGAGSEDSIAVTPDGRFLLNATAGETRFWDLQAIGDEADPPRREAPPSYHINRVAPDGSRLFHGPSDAERSPICIDRLPSPTDTAEAITRIKLKELTKEEFTGASFFSSGDAVISLTSDCEVDLWDARRGERILGVKGRKISRAIGSSNGRKAAYLSGDTTIHVLDADSGKMVTLKDHALPISAAAMSGNGKVVLSAGGQEMSFFAKPESEGKEPDSALRVWDTDMGTLTHKLAKTSQHAERIVTDRHGWGAAILSQEFMGMAGGILEFWDIEFGIRRASQFIAPILVGLDSRENIDLAPDGASAVAGAFNNETRGIQFFQSFTQEAHPLEGGDHLFSSVGFVRSGSIVVAHARLGGKLDVWDFATGERIATHDSPPKLGDGGFGWIDGEKEACICHNGAGPLTFRLRNLPPRHPSIEQLISSLDPAHPRRCLTGLWYGIDHPAGPVAETDKLPSYMGTLLDLIRIPEGAPFAEAIRYAASRAAVRQGERILPQLEECLASDSDGRQAGLLAMTIGSIAGPRRLPLKAETMEALQCHPDLPVRKRLILVLNRYPHLGKAPPPDETEDGDSSIGEFARLCRSGAVEFSALDSNAAPRSGEDRSLALCPTSMEKLQATTDLFGEGIQKYGRKGRMVLRGNSHPYLESILLDEKLVIAEAMGDSDKGKRVREDLSFIRQAHDLSGDIDEKTRTYLDRLAALKSVSIPVKRVLGGLVRRSRSEEDWEYLFKCLSYIEEGFEPVAAPAFIAVREEANRYDEEEDLFGWMGVRNLEELSPGLGPQSWREYADEVSFDPAKLLYCIANEMVQSHFDFWGSQEKDPDKLRPRPERHFLAERVLNRMGCGDGAARLRRVHERLFGDFDEFSDTVSFFDQFEFGPLLEEGLAGSPGKPKLLPLWFLVIGVSALYGLVICLIALLAVWLTTFTPWLWIVTGLLFLAANFLCYRLALWYQVVFLSAKRLRDLDWRRFDRAMSLWKSNHLDEALKELETHRIGVELAGNQQALALVLIESGLIHHQAGRESESLENLQSAEEILRAQENQNHGMIPTLMQRTLSSQFLILRRSHADDEKLYAILEKMFHSAKTANDTESLKFWGGEMTRLSMCRNDFEKVIQFCADGADEAMLGFLQLEKKTRAMDEGQFRTALRNRSNILGLESELQQLAEWCEEMLKTAGKTSHIGLTIWASLRHATALANLEDFSGACRSTGRALVLARDGGFPRQCREALLIRGEIALAENDWKTVEMIATEMESLSGINSDGGDEMDRDSLRLRAILCDHNGQQESSIEIWSGLLSRARADGNDFAEARALAHLGGLQEASPEAVSIAETLHGLIWKLGEGKRFDEQKQLFRQLGSAWPQFSLELSVQLQRMARAEEEKRQFDHSSGLQMSAILLTPEHPVVLNHAAWFFATCPAAACRQGDLAVLLAEKACRLSDWADWALVDTYAAALAETGKFQKAIRTARKALELAPDENARTQVREALERYVAGAPMRRGEADLPGPTARCSPEQKEILAGTGYPLEAFDFLLNGFQSALQRAADVSVQSTPDGSPPSLAILLSRGLCEYAKEQFGENARRQLEEWNIHRSDDFGRILATLIEIGLVNVEGDLEIGSFSGLFPLEDVLE